MPCSADRRFSLMLAVTACCAIMAAGCSYAVSPARIPVTIGQEGGSLQGAVVLVRSGETDTTLYPVPNASGGRSGLLADRRIWTQKLVEALASALARRGAQVRSDAPLTLNLSLPGITFLETETSYEMRVQAAVVATGGYSGTFMGTARASKYRVASGTAEADRLAGEALADAVRSMLGDAGLRGLLTGNK